MLVSTNLFWKKARDEFKKELVERNTFNRQYLRMQECDYEKDFMKIYRPKLDYWRPYLYQAINQNLGKAYILDTYSDRELENIVTLLDEAIDKHVKCN